MILTTLVVALLAASSHHSALAQTTTTVLVNDTQLIYSGPGVGSGVAWGNPGLDPWIYTDRTCGTGIIATTELGAAVSLIFTGTSVTVNLISGQAGALITVFIDGAPFQIVATDLTTGHYWTCGVVPVTAENLSDTTHNVTVAKQVSTGLLFLQDIVYTGVPPPQSTTLSLSSTLAASSSAPTVGNVTASNTTNASSSTPRAHSSSAPAIGGAIGGVLVVVGLIVAFLLYRRRQNQRDPPHYENGAPYTSTYNMPYTPVVGGGGHSPMMNENKLEGYPGGVVHMTIEEIPSTAPLSVGYGYQDGRGPWSPPQSPSYLPHLQQQHQQQQQQLQPLVQAPTPTSSVVQAQQPVELSDQQQYYNDSKAGLISSASTPIESVDHGQGSSSSTFEAGPSSVMNLPVAPAPESFAHPKASDHGKVIPRNEGGGGGDAAPPPAYE
ncbi:hypothetical protein FRB96_005727 [Tulasnella sp. 330]|nr:hypothetical protein FRB96_005727 [Tulasnella sp. 330]KAG8870847.1 hypothetical protein FRB97_009304 [Tulasnella sp. 331]